MLHSGSKFQKSMRTRSNQRRNRVEGTWRESVMQTNQGVEYFVEMEFGQHLNGKSFLLRFRYGRGIIIILLVLVCKLSDEFKSHFSTFF